MSNQKEIRSHYTYWRIFDKDVKYFKPKRRGYRDDTLYNFLITHKKITLDDMHNMGFNNPILKIERINKGGKFLLTKFNNTTWYIKEINVI